MRAKSQNPYFSFMSILPVALILMTSQALYSQSVVSGFGLEIGVGSSQLFTDHFLPPLKNYRPEATYFDFSPEVRLHYIFRLTDECSCIPFVGYNRFDGSYIITYTDKYGSEIKESAIWFHVLEIGLIATYNISSFSCGIGYKANRQFKTTDIYYFPHMNILTNDGYRAWTHDAGVRVSYSVSHYSFSAESWLGLSDLEWNSDHWNVRRNHFRVLFGYTK